MANKKHLEQEGPFAGLWVRTAGVLKRAGYASKEQIRADLICGKLQPCVSGVQDYGHCTHRETSTWAFQIKSSGVPTQCAAVEITEQNRLHSARASRRHRLR